ncbi:DUF1993 domain-containing protein [Roseateles toxinivorans]|uniref:DUF1993 domain-containing protein n=1 Tax=Roseateles toxinivorans TaxID=270368 RepID=A0A4R6QLM5_9BURK|nr:DUF1993 domain-containing protein [Roseateles toxinivorans]TDP64313.1 hypothetical protein DES47_104603 [Roseateles toxinivorans]
MTISMYSASVPVFVKLLSNTLKWLDKAEQHAEAKKFDTSVYLGLRLAPDMLPFTRQIQIASDAAKGCVARLAGIENPKWEDKEASLAELRERISKTIAFVQSVTPAQIDGSEQRAIEIPTRAGEPLRFDGETYLKHYALANFNFHLSMTYALLRHAGVDLGKKDFLGG